jgi:hypothetical protein
MLATQQNPINAAAAAAAAGSYFPGWRRIVLPQMGKEEQEEMRRKAK